MDLSQPPRGAVRAAKTALRDQVLAGRRRLPLEDLGALGGQRGEALERDVIAKLELVGLGEWRDTKVKEFSKGMAQRVGVAQSLMGDPELVFLDEPTDGVDPVARQGLRYVIRQATERGATVFINSHLLSEIEVLCDRVAIVDHGRIIAQGTPRQLIAGLGADQIVFFALEESASALFSEEVRLAVADSVGNPPRATDGGWELGVAAPHIAIPALLSALQQHGMPLSELRTHSPTLEDVFVSLTGRALRDD